MGGLILANYFAKIGSPQGTDFGKGDQFWLPKVVQLDQFCQQKVVQGPVLSDFSAKLSSWTDFRGGSILV